jgi:uncharacterized membrane protein
MSREPSDGGWFRRLSQTYLTGVLGLLPLALTFAILAWLVVFLHDLVGPTSFLGKKLIAAGMAATTCDVTAYFIGMAGMLLLVYGMGLLVESGSALRWRGMMDHSLRRVPVVNTVYDASKNLTSMFDRRQDSLQGMTPVICYFGDDHAAGVPALMPTGELVRMDGIDYRMVIVPTAPVPFGGALLCVKADWVKPVDCSFDELLGIYMSMGMSAPAHLADPPSA